MSKELDNAIYAAEHVVFRRCFPRHLTDPNEYLDSVMRSKAFANRWPGLHRRRDSIGIRDSTLSYAYTDVWTKQVHMPTWYQNDFTVLHELGHVCVTGKYDYENHNPTWVACHLWLTKHFMSAEAGICYRYALLAQGVTIGREPAIRKKK